MHISKKRSGLTLVEVIISLIILSVVIIGLLGFFSQGYLNILGTRKRNQDNYNTQAYFEQEMSTAKRDGAGGTETIPFTFNYGNGSSATIDVMGKTVTYANTNIRLFLSNQKEATLELPENLLVTIEGAAPYYYVDGKIPSGKAELEADTIDSIKTDMEEAWFLSHRKVGEQGVVPVGDLVTNKDGSATTRLVRPVMSNTTRDVAMIKKSNTGMDVTDRMRGKYLTFGARVYSTFGRVGQYHVAEPIWIMGIPVVDGLSVHTDADLATTVDGGAIETTDQPIANGLGTIVRNYRDKNTDTSQYKGNVPVWNVYESDLKQTRQFIAFQGDRSYFDEQDLFTDAGTTVSLLIGNKVQSGNLLSFEIGDLKWHLNLAENGVMTADIIDSTNLNFSGSTIIEKGSFDHLDYSKDHSFQVKVTKGATNHIQLELFLDGTSIHQEQLIYNGSRDGQTITHPVRRSKIVFGGNTYINELAIYNKALTSNEMSSLTNYFAGKYDTDYNAN